MTTGPARRPDDGAGERVRRAWEVFQASLLLGLTSFGGPIAHLGHFERVYVRQHRWLSGENYAGLVALCQVLPGPASSQVGFLLGLHRAGWAGALAAWLGFTLPSALLMYACATLSAQAQGPLAQAAVHGLKLVAVAVVAQAAWSMARRLCPDRPTAAIALLVLALLLTVGGTSMQLAALAAGGLAGVLWCGRGQTAAAHLPIRIHPACAWTALGLFVLLLIALPALASRSPHSLVALAAVFYRAGALVFGGGHVVLPLLRDALVPGGWISDDHFLTGYGLAQALPGPLFTLAAYLGAAGNYVQLPALSSAIAVICIFLPGLLIAVAGASLWSSLARHAWLRAAIVGINAAVVGILAAALYDPVWTTAVHGGTDAAIATVGFILLQRWKAPVLAIVALCVGASVVSAFA